MKNIFDFIVVFFQKQFWKDIFTTYLINVVQIKAARVMASTFNFNNKVLDTKITPEMLEKMEGLFPGNLDKFNELLKDKK